MTPWLFKENYFDAKNNVYRLVGYLSCLEHCPVHQKVAGLIPSQSKYLGFFILGQGIYRGQPIHVSLSHWSFSFSLSLFLSFFFSSPPQPFLSKKSVEISSGEDNNNNVYSVRSFVVETKSICD